MQLFYISGAGQELQNGEQAYDIKACWCYIGDYLKNAPNQEGGSRKKVILIDIHP